MGIILPRLLGIGALFLFIFLTGLWLGQAGKPYSVVVLTIHKLVTLAAIGLLAVTVYETNQAVKLSPTELTLAAVTGLLFLATIMGGGLLSIERSMPAVVSTVHRIAPFLTAFSAAATLYFLIGRN